MIEFVQQDVNDLQDEVRLDWHEDLGIEVRLQALDHLIEQA